MVLQAGACAPERIRGGPAAEEPMLERQHLPSNHADPYSESASILGSFAEMPGLSLHLHQAARLFALPEATCRAVLSQLVRDGRLRQSADNQYRAAGSGTA